MLLNRTHPQVRVCGCVRVCVCMRACVRVYMSVCSYNICLCAYVSYCAPLPFPPLPSPSLPSPLLPLPPLPPPLPDTGLPFNAQPKRGVKFNKEDSEKLAQVSVLPLLRTIGYLLLDINVAVGFQAWEVKEVKESEAHAVGAMCSGQECRQ